MKCPKCGESAIGFTTWLRGTNAFRTKCMQCGTPLKANMVVYILFVLTVTATLSLIPYMDEILNFFDISTVSNKLKLVVLFPLIFIGAIAAWLTGGYKNDI